MVYVIVLGEVELVSNKYYLSLSGAEVALKDLRSKVDFPHIYRILALERI